MSECGFIEREAGVCANASALHCGLCARHCRQFHPRANIDSLDARIAEVQRALALVARRSVTHEGALGVLHDVLAELESHRPVKAEVS